MKILLKQFFFNGGKAVKLDKKYSEVIVYVQPIIEANKKGQQATGLLLVKGYDNKTGLGVFCLVIYPLAKPLVPNPQKKIKIKIK